MTIRCYLYSNHTLRLEYVVHRTCLSLISGNTSTFNDIFADLMTRSLTLCFVLHYASATPQHVLTAIINCDHSATILLTWQT